MSCVKLVRINNNNNKKVLSDIITEKILFLWFIEKSYTSIQNECSLDAIFFETPKIYKNFS
jgi:hypothetical protein